MYQSKILPEDPFKARAWDIALDSFTDLVRQDPVWLSSCITLERNIGGYTATLARPDKICYTQFIPDHEEETNVPA